MREIKFKAYDTQAMCMLGGGSMQMNATTGRLDYLPSVVPLQYIGLKDKNGKEIYEGDILALGKLGTRRVVDYRRGCFIARKLNEDSSRCLKGTQLKYHSQNWEQQAEIIGNIYEGLIGK